MGGRKPDIEQHQRVFTAIEGHPGLTAAQIARVMGLEPRIVISLLPSMEATGFLLSEDGGGRLYTFFQTDICGERRRWAVRLYRAGFALREISEIIFGYRGGNTAKQIESWVDATSGDVI